MRSEKKSAEPAKAKNPLLAVPPRLAAFWSGYVPHALTVLEQEGIAAMNGLGFTGKRFLHDLDLLVRSVKRLATEMPGSFPEELLSLCRALYYFWSRLLGKQALRDDDSPAQVTGDQDDPELASWDHRNGAELDRAIEVAWLSRAPTAKRDRLIQLVEEVIGSNPHLGPWYRLGLAFGQLNVSLVDGESPLGAYTRMLKDLRELQSVERSLVPGFTQLNNTPRSPSNTQMAMAISAAAIACGHSPPSLMPLGEWANHLALDALRFLIPGIQDGLMATAPAIPLFRPYWDPESRILRFGEDVIYKFASRADPLVTLLSAFEDAGWPEKIQNPFTDDPGQPAQDKLAQTVKDLQRRTRGFLKFHRMRSIVRWTRDSDDR